MKYLLRIIACLLFLDVSNNITLTEFDCRFNNLSAAALNSLFETLHDINQYGVNKHIDIANNPGSADCDRSIATSKGWVVY